MVCLGGMFAARARVRVWVVSFAAEVSAGCAFQTGEDSLSRHFGLDLCYKQVQRLAERIGAIMWFSLCVPHLLRHEVQRK